MSTNTDVSRRPASTAPAEGQALPARCPRGRARRCGKTPTGTRPTDRETTVGSFKNELIRWEGTTSTTWSWAPPNGWQWFLTEHSREYLDDFTPEVVEKLDYDHRRTPPKAE